MKKNYLLFSVAVVSFGFLFSTAFAIGGVGGAPLKPLDPNHRGWFMYELGPGATYKDVLVVKNTTKKDWFVDVYPADQTPSSSGGFALKQKVEEMTRMGTWIKLAKDRVFVKSGGSVQVPFTITIPRNVDVGETAGGILMEKVDPKSLQKSRQATQAGVRISLRTGVRVYNIVSGDIKEELAMTKSFLRPKKASDWQNGPIYFFSQSVENLGTISTTAKFIIKVKELWQDEVIFDSSEEPGTFLISPQDTFDYNQDLQLPKFGKFEVTSEVSMIDRQDVESFINSKTHQIIVLPLKEIAVGVAIIFVVTIFIILHHRKYSGKGWVGYTVKANDTIASIAAGHGIDWEFLAKVNRIKSPYILEKGGKIVVPPKKKK